MMFWQRLCRVVRHLLDRAARNPDRALAAMSAELETRLAEGRASLFELEQQQRLLADRAANAAGDAEAMLRLARRAMRLGREDWAREAAARHLQAAAQARRCAAQWRRQQEQTETLRRIVAELDAQWCDLEHRRQALRTRRTLARLQRHALHGRYAEPVRETLDQAEARARQEQQATEAYRALTADPLAEDHDTRAVERLVAQLRAEHPPLEGTA